MKHADVTVQEDEAV